MNGIAMKKMSSRSWVVAALFVGGTLAIGARVDRPSSVVGAALRGVPAATDLLSRDHVSFEAAAGRLRTPARSGGESGVFVDAPSEGSGRFEVRQRGGHRAAKVVLAGAASVPATLEQGRAVYRDAYPGIDVVASADERSLELLYVARRVPAPEELHLAVSLGAGEVLQEEPGTHAVIVRGARHQVDARITPPVAIDHRGRRRAGTYRIAGSELRLVIDGTGLEAPLVIDPAIALPFWSIVSDDRVPAAAVYDSAILSHEAHLSFDAGRARTVLVRPVRSRFDTDISYISGDAADPVSYQAGSGVSEVGGVQTILPTPRSHPHAPFPGVAATDDFERSYDLESETWEWYGGQWSLVQTARLPGLVDPAMAYDGARGRTVLYGGVGPSGWGCSSIYGSISCGEDLSGFQANSATYEYDGVTWSSKLIPGSPPPRLRAAMAWSPALGKTLLFGGRGFGTPTSISVWTSGPPYPESLTNGLLADTWIYDGSSWSLVPTGHPPPAMEGAQLLYDASRSVFVLVGGHTASETAPAVDRLAIWEFDGTDWTQKLAPGDTTQPPSIATRYGAAAFYNPLRNRVTVFGGTVGQLDACTLTAAQIAAQLAATQNDPVGRTALQATGCLGGYVHDSWEWDGTTLTNVAGVVFAGAVGANPQPVFEQKAGGASWATEGAAAGDAGTLVAAGPTSLLSYRYDRSSTHFRPRTSLELAHYPADAGAPPPEETTTGTTAPLVGAGASPLFTARIHPDVLFDPSRGVATVFAPDTAAIYETDGATWQVRTPARTPFSNGPNDFLGMAWDSAGQRIVAFDPRDGSTWAHGDGGAWTPLAVAGSPPPWTVDPSVHAKRDFVRSSAEVGQGIEAAAFTAAIPQMPRMTFDRARGRVVMLYQGATWEFDGATWTRFPYPPSWSSCPAATFLAFDGTRNVSVAFGCNVPADTWTWNGSQWVGPGPTPFTAALERTYNGITFPQASSSLPDWFAPLQLGWAHPNAAFESVAFAGVSTVDADGTLRTWNGTAWTAGPQIASQGFCVSSIWDPSQSGYPSQGGGNFAVSVLSGSPFRADTNYWTGRELMPTCISPPLVEDSANGRLLAFRDGPLGLLQLPLGSTPSQSKWTGVLLGTEGIAADNPNLQGTVAVNPYPFELMAPEAIHLQLQSNPTTRTGNFGVFGATGVPEPVVQNVWWPYRILQDPTTQAIRLVTSRGMVWQLQGEDVSGLGDPCQSDYDCGAGSCGSEGVCCDLGLACTQTMCQTCRGATPGVCGPASAGQVDPSGACGTGACAGTCPGPGQPASCTYHPTTACGGAPSCSAGVLTPGGSCSPNGPSCLPPSASSAQACPNGAGCASATTCLTGCTLRTDCASTYSDCNVGGVCAPDQASQLATQQGISPALDKPPPRLTNQEIAAMMTDAGIPQDDAGVFYLASDDPNAAMVRSFDPARSTPVTSMRNCMQYIEACALVNSGNFDGCVAQAPRCASATPWAGDPAGIECCPQSCLVVYMQTRETQPAGVAFSTMARSTCVLGNVTDGGIEGGVSDGGHD
jgi:hypothetical protein